MSKKEDKNEVVLNNDMIVVLENQKDSLTSIHENMDALILRANQIQININDSNSYEQAVELKREIKATHIKIKDKRNELKRPLIQLGRELDHFTKTIYDPLVEAEKQVKSKMEEYEAEQERIKKEQKEAKNNEGKMRELLDQKLHDLNATLLRINQCKTQAEIEIIQQELSNINLKDFGERSDEAGFILGNLIQTCTMVKKVLPEGEAVSFKIKNTTGVNPPVVLGGEKEVKKEVTLPHIIPSESSHKIGVSSNAKEEKKVTDQLTEENIEKLKSGEIDEIHAPKEILDEMPFVESVKMVRKEKIEKPENLHSEGRMIRKGEPDPVLVDISSDIPENLDEVLMNKKEILASQFELDFGAVAEQQAKKKQEPKPVKEKYFSAEKVNDILASSVLPLAIHNDVNESDINKIITVSSITKGEGDLPKELILTIESANGLEVINGTYSLILTERQNGQLNIDEEE